MITVIDEDVVKWNQQHYNGVAVTDIEPFLAEYSGLFNRDSPAFASIFYQSKNNDAPTVWNINTYRLLIIQPYMEKRLLCRLCNCDRQEKQLTVQLLAIYDDSGTAQPLETFHTITLEITKGHSQLYSVQSRELAELFTDITFTEGLTLYVCYDEHVLSEVGELDNGYVLRHHL